MWSGCAGFSRCCRWPRSPSDEVSIAAGQLPRCIHFGTIGREGLGGGLQCPPHDVADRCCCRVGNPHADTRRRIGTCIRAHRASGAGKRTRVESRLVGVEPAGAPHQRRKRRTPASARVRVRVTTSVASTHVGLVERSCLESHAATKLMICLRLCGGQFPCPRRCATRAKSATEELLRAKHGEHNGDSFA